MRAIRFVILSALTLGAGVTVAAAQAISVGAVITGEVMPGVYGRVVIGNAPPPPVLYAQPVVIEPAPVGVAPLEPIYLHVPPEHAHEWRRHCHEYHACNRPVYFVRSPEYEPGFDRERWRREHEHERHEEREHHEHDRGDRDHERGHDDHDHDHRG